ncbi:hypothetical protein [[Phormidium] sp. ETS-05]|uniref:hypothetical protein n=1 Tax=[Phormidium] sp. ETS-05 TaxID=222819 RepID=UPI0018EF04B2|nr:hypothetical protein [[Phormidium] sp. ETS-05]
MTAPIGEIIRAGVIFDIKNWENSPPNADNLPEVIERLFTILSARNINHLLVGGVALLSYIEGRNTQDINFIIAKSALNLIPEISVSEENQNFVRGNFENLQIDILLTQNSLFDWVSNNLAVERNFGGKMVRCVTVEGLVILKLYALPSLYRQGQFARVSIYENDILLLLLNYAVDIDKVFSTLSPHLLATDIQEIRQTTADIQARIARFSAQKRNLEENK